MKRKECYQWLADNLKISVDDCHIGMMDTETCNRVVKICKEEKHP
jgi:hypothetical protein